MDEIQFFTYKNSNLLKFKMRALNAKPKAELVSKIIDAIIINFIYYRHSNLNVCLPLFKPDALHSVFFYLSLHQLILKIYIVAICNDY